MTDFCIYEELMPKIQALISPPDNINPGTSREKNTAELHPYFKRRGKRHNHDYCDACGERGNVILCANCPSSFHLLCHDPPLKEKDIANGHWICNACQYAEKNHQPKPTEKPTQRRSTSHSPSEKSAKASTIATPSRTSEPSSTNSIHSTSNKTRSPAMDDTLSIVLRDSIAIKNESIDEENIGSDLEESSDDADSVENAPIKTECNDEDPILRTNLEFPLKTEPEADYHGSSTGDVNGLNMDDVWKILGIDNRVKVNTVKEPNRKVSSDDGAGVSKNSSDHFEMANFIETVKRNQIHINLTNCDYMLKDRKSSDVITDSADETDHKKQPLGKPKRNRRQTKASAVDHATGIKRAFVDIITDASKVNPKQFTLPVEYITNIDMNLIGTEKDTDNLPNDLDSRDLLKLPARKCYYCKGTCLVGQMISCDFCPAHFHLNCLNPPLCNIPDVKWMCPLHPHHVLERVMKNPSSITELMSWWSKFSVPIDDEDVKSNFIEKVKSHDKRSTNRRTIRSSVNIPDIVKYHYKHPAPRIPSLEELVRSESTSIFDNNYTSTRHDTIDRTNNRFSNTQESAVSTTPTHSQPQTSKPTAPAQQTATTSQINNNSKKKYNLRPFKKAKWKSLLEIASDQRSTSKKSSTNGTKIPESESGPSSDNTVSTNEPVFNSNEIHQNGDTCEKLHKPVDHSESNLSWKKIENYVIRDINRNFITGGISITTLSEDIRRLLMIQKIKQLTEDVPPSFTPSANPYPLFHPLMKDDINDTLPDRPKGNVRAVLCPLSHRPLIYMYGQSLSIGLGFSNDICLRNYGNCNFISEDHAVIFYDKVTNTYELINYSEYNTIVDGVCYSCDISANTSDPPANQTTKPDTPTIPKPAKKPLKKKSTSTSSISCRVQSKRTGSTVTAAETRNTYKKLINDIDKLVSKSQQEMTAIADEDLNEISKAIKNAPVTRTNQDVQPVKKRIQRINRVKTKRKSSEVSDDPKPLKIPRRSKPVARLVEATEDAGNSNEGQRVPKTRPNTMKKLTKPRRRAQPVAKSRTRPGRLGKLKRTPNSTIQVPNEDIECPSDLPVDQTDDEYLLGDNFFVNPKRSPCRCQATHQKFPNGRDSSWERTAPLNHGSYIQFGCIEFIFSIVNYPGPTDTRPYIVPEPNQPPNRSPESEESLQPVHPLENKDDLTIKLMSILNLLSSKPPENTPDLVPSHQPSPSSSFSSRSSSPVLQNGHASDRSESPQTAGHIDGQIEITG